MRMDRAMVAQARPRQSCHWCVHARTRGGHWRPSCHAATHRFAMIAASNVRNMGHFLALACCGSVRPASSAVCSG